MERNWTLRPPSYFYQAEHYGRNAVIYGVADLGSAILNELFRRIDNLDFVVAVSGQPELDTHERIVRLNCIVTGPWAKTTFDRLLNNLIEATALSQEQEAARPRRGPLPTSVASH